MTKAIYVLQVIPYDYAYYKEDDKYKKIIGITQDEENVAKIINTYNIDGEVSKYLLTNKEIASKITTYDILLKTATSKDEIKQIVTETLKYYKDKNLKLIKVD